jgi:SNF2 family DNA or RNA helicase
MLGRLLYKNELPLKTDMIVWLDMTNVQKNLYKMVSEGEKEKIKWKKADEKTFIVAIINELKYICTHPFLLFHHDCKRYSKFKVIIRLRP